MATKSPQPKKTAVIPTGLKRSKRRIDPALRKMVHEDHAIASGGRNTMRRAPAFTR